jgi:hypothetical protein
MMICVNSAEIQVQEKMKQVNDHLSFTTSLASFGQNNEIMEKKESRPKPIQIHSALFSLQLFVLILYYAYEDIRLSITQKLLASRKCQFRKSYVHRIETRIS